MQDWEELQFKDLRHPIPEYLKFVASNILFVALSILDSYLEKKSLKLTLTSGIYKTSLETPPRP